MGQHFYSIAKAITVGFFGLFWSLTTAFAVQASTQSPRFAGCDPALTSQGAICPYQNTTLLGAPNAPDIPFSIIALLAHGERETPRAASFMRATNSLSNPFALLLPKHDMQHDWEKVGQWHGHLQDLTTPEAGEQRAGACCSNLIRKPAAFPATPRLSAEFVLGASTLFGLMLHICALGRLDIKRDRTRRSRRKTRRALRATPAFMLLARHLVTRPKISRSKFTRMPIRLLRHT